LTENLQAHSYLIEPLNTQGHDSLIFQPQEAVKFEATLFIKNNLTHLYPIKIKGEGGGGYAEVIQVLHMDRYNNTRVDNCEKDDKVIDISIRKDDLY
jgi:hypothetical protein